MRILIAILSFSFTVVLLCTVLWYGYFGLYWFAGQLFEPSLGLVVIAAPVCLLVAIVAALVVLHYGLQIASTLDDRFTRARSIESRNKNPDHQC